MTRMGIEFVPDSPITDIVRWAKLAEDMGFDNIWLTDHYNNRNLWVTLTAVAQNTDRIIIGPGVTNPYHTSPALSAAAIATIGEMIGDRIAIGLGAGDRVTLSTLGLDWDRPVTTVIEGLKILRHLLNGEKVVYDGEVFRIHGARLSFVKRERKPYGEVPIYAGVQGPMMLMKTAPLVDGLLINASHPLDFKFALKKIKEGLQGTEKSINDLDIAAYTAFSLADSRDEALNDETKVIVGFIVAGSPEAVLERHKLNMRDCERVSMFLRKGKFDELRDSVTEEMVDAFAIVGNTEYCIERIEGLVQEGVTHFIVGSPIGPDKDETIRRIGKDIIPEVKNMEEKSIG